MDELNVKLHLFIKSI